MSFNDTVSDLVARVKNAKNAKLFKLEAKHSSMAEDVLVVLQEEGYIKSFGKKEIRQGVRMLEIFLRYHNGDSAMVDIKRVSTAGRRVYFSVEKLKNKKHFNGLGIFILSTSKGVMSDRKARQLNVGGEVICNVY
jgi:small subunit ribosomal protein S8